jgi:hypothetical protein
MRDAVNADTAPAARLSTSDQSGPEKATPFKGPFKGKGAGCAGGDPRNCRNELEAVERAMRQVKQQCLQLDPLYRRFYLDVVQRPTRGRPTRTLRWRHSSGRHTTWACVEAALGNFARPIRNIMAEWNQQAVRINARARGLRQQLRDLERCR